MGKVDIIPKSQSEACPARLLFITRNVMTWKDDRRQQKAKKENKDTQM
jgi:hypothetical protein